MKFCFAILLLSFSTAAWACDDGMLCGTENIPDFWDGLNGQVLHKDMERPENFPAYVYEPKGSSNLRIGRYFIDGKYPTGPMKCEHLELHNGQSDDVLTWEAHNTAASNVYYHVHRAIDYYNWLSKQIGEPIYKETKPIIIRVGMNVQWAKWIKFSKIARFNMSQTYPDSDPDKWGTADEQREVWFYVPVRDYMPKYVLLRYIPGIRDTVLGTRGFPLDSARVPSIIYHEWTHLMTRPFLGIDDDGPLNEGYSDYYGSVIWGRPEMGEGGEFTSFPYVRDLTVEPSRITLDDMKTPGNFVPRFLWSLRRRYGGARVDVLAFKALKFLNPKSKLTDLPAALLKAASDRTFAPDEIKEMTEQMNRLFKVPTGRSGD